MSPPAIPGAVILGLYGASGISHMVRREWSSLSSSEDVRRKRISYRMKYTFLACALVALAAGARAGTKGMAGNIDVGEK